MYMVQHPVPLTGRGSLCHRFLWAQLAIRLCLLTVPCFIQQQEHLPSLGFSCQCVPFISCWDGLEMCGLRLMTTDSLVPSHGARRHEHSESLQPLTQLAHIVPWPGPELWASLWVSPTKPLTRSWSNPLPFFLGDPCPEVSVCFPRDPPRASPKRRGHFPVDKMLTVDTSLLISLLKNINLVFHFAKP